MSAVRLLSAPVDTTTSAQEVSSQSTALVTSSRVLSARTIARDGSSVPSDNYVWSVSVGDDGAFNFYAAPRQSSSSFSSADWHSNQGQATYGASWNSVQARNAAYQYSLYANAPSMMAASYGHSLDVYA